VDHTDETFETEIQQLPKGSLLEANLRAGEWSLCRWYHLHPTPWKQSFPEACAEFYYLLNDSVRLRMRSDVPVGSALSGGLDSSTIVCLMRRVLESQSNGGHPIKTITSCYADRQYDEWEYAEQVVRSANAKPYRIFPTFEKLLKDLDQMLWHMDFPFYSTSQFSQWCVFEGAAAAGLKVMIDGQGADEQLAGYAGMETRLFTGLLGKGQWMEFFRETAAYKRRNNQYPTAAVMGAIEYHTPAFLHGLWPQRRRQVKPMPPQWLKKNHSRQLYAPPGSLHESLRRQVTGRPLPGLLRYEDRNSMAFSIESRVPFMDHRVMEFTLGLPENFVFRRGVQKYILREAFAGLVPDQVLARRDKMGFVSPEERWLKEEGNAWFCKEVADAGKYMAEFIHQEKAGEMVQAMAEGKEKFSFTPWRILSLNRYVKMISEQFRPM
ncbi:MAG: asparagine synthase, partial [Phaeodactylibacter sp.]|nr:asparagine synthase [Phaeodactylibacter sp.]